ncbi:hypothetical protein FRC17_010297 [Serendipita sp. 399]|nr:hypothetical protein FRC17_010297 [Serendipita sp. 399]
MLRCTNVALWILTVLLFHILGGVQSLHNVTIDDMDPSVTYVGTWLTAVRSERYMGTTHYTKVEGSYARFSFTGAIKVHYMGFGIRDRSLDARFAVTLDGKTEIGDGYRDVSERVQAILWSSTELDPAKTHTIECRKISADNGGDLNVDAFILTIPDSVTQTSSVRTSTIVASPSSVGSILTSGTTVNPAGSSGLASTPTSTLSNIVWSPSLSIITQYASGVTEPPLSGSVQIDGSSSPIPLSKSTVVGIVFASISVLCMIAAIFFYLGRRRTPPKPLESLYTSAFHTEGAQKYDQRVDDSASPVPIQPSPKHERGAHDEPEPASPLSSGNTQSRSNYLRASNTEFEVVTDVPESTIWTPGPPAYTAQPISGHHASVAIPTIDEDSISQRISRPSPGIKRRRLSF